LPSPSKLKNMPSKKQQKQQAAQLKMEAVGSFETSGSLQTTRRYNPGDCTHHLNNRHIPKIGSYSLENTLYLHYKVQFVND
jgi:hypothetical protein